MTGKTLGAGLLAVLISISFSTDLLAQGGTPLRIRDISSDELPTPDYQVRRVSLGSGETKRWTLIEVEYETAPEWIDQVDFRYYALVENDEGEGRDRFILFRGEVSNVNVARGRHTSVMYLHPSTIERYSDVERVAVEVRVAGRLVATDSDPSADSRWWEQLSPTDGYLLNRLETPFAMLNFDNYEALKAGSANNR